MNTRFVALCLDRIMSMSSLVWCHLSNLQSFHFSGALIGRMKASLHTADQKIGFARQLKWGGLLTRYYTCVFVLVFLYSSPALNVSAESEPNDEIKTANILPLNGSQQGQFSVRGDEDWYVIECSESGRLLIGAEKNPARARVEIAMYGRHAEWIYQYQSAVNQGDDVYLELDIVEPGIYFIRFRDLDLNFGEETYSLSATLTPSPDPQEWNGSLGDATVVSSPDVQGRIFPRGDHDFYRIYVDSDSLVKLTLQSPDSMRGDLAWFNSNFDWMYINTSAVNAGDPVFLDAQIEQAGYYYIRVRDVNDLSHTEPYSLEIAGANIGFSPGQTPVVAEVENNSESGSANLISLGSLVSGEIAAEGDHDWFNFDVNGPNLMTLSMEASSSELLLQVDIYNPSKGHLISARSGHPGDAFSLTYPFVNSGRYFLRIHSHQNPSVDTGYRFRTDAIPVEDSFEPNNDYGDANLLTQLNQVEGFIFPNGDQDWYRVQINQPGHLSAIMSGVPENITPVVDFFNLSKRHLAGRSGAAGVDLRLDYEIGEPGTYLIRIHDAGSNDLSTDSYTLTVLGATFESYAPIARIESINPGAVVVGDSITFVGSGDDVDGEVIGYEWRSSLDGILSQEAQFETSTMTVGTHDVYLRVRDNQGIWSTEVLELVYVGSSVSDEIEPNGSLYEANEFALNRPLTGKIEAQREEDFFKVYVPGAGRVIFELTNVPVNLRMEIALYNRHWDWIYRNASATEVGDNVAVTVDVTEAGLVYARIRDVISAHNEEFTYTLAAYFEPAPDVYEPNYSALNAKVMPQQQVEGFFFPNNDHDWFRIWAEEGAILTAEVTSVPVNVRAEVAWFGRNREWLYRNQASVNAGDSVTAQAEIEKTGFYFVRVRNVEGYNWTHPYTLNVTGGMVDFEPDRIPSTAETEPNDEMADGVYVTIGSPVTGSIRERGDVDWYVFELTAPGILEISLDQIPADLRGRIQLFKDDVAHIVTRQATNPGDPQLLTVNLTDPAIYHIRIDHVGGDLPVENPYLLGLNLIPVVDVNEPNNRFHDSTLLTQKNRVEGYIFNYKDEDFYRVRARAEDTLRITVNDVPTEIRPQIEIFNFHHRHQSTKRATNDGQSITLEYLVPETGEYTIRIRDVGDNDISVEPYTLLVDGATFESYVPMAWIDSMIPNPATQEEVVTLLGHGEDADGNIIGYEWRSSIDGVFSISQNTSSDGLSTGIHEIFYKVKDNDQNWSPETSDILFYGVPAPQEQEPNNVAGSATFMELERQYKGSMASPDDHDWYRISIPGPGSLRLDFNNTSEIKMRGELAMYNTEVGWAYVNVSADNEGDSLTLNWDLVEAGNYFLRIHDHHRHADAEYTIIAHFAPVPDPFEPNHHFMTASPIAVNDVVEAFIYPAGEEDWYEVEFQTSGAFHMSLTDMPSDMRMEVAMYGPNLEWLYVNANAGNPGDNVFKDYDVPHPGIYFIRVRDLDRKRSLDDSYQLTTSFEEVSDPFEPNHDFWNAKLVQQSSLSAYIFPNGDQDFYRIFAPGGGPLDITLEQVPENLRMELALYNVDYGWMYLNPSSAALGDPVSLHLEEASGYYFLRVRAVEGGRSANQMYRLSFVGADLTHVLPTETSPTEAEPNNGLPGANRIAEGITTGAFHGDEDWYAIEIDARAEWVVELIPTANNRPQIDLYDSNKGHMGGYEAENKGDPCHLTRSITSSGVYYIRVIDDDNAATEESYQLHTAIHLDPDEYEDNGSYATAVPINLNSPVVGNLFPTGDQDWFVFEVVESGTVHFNLANQAQNIQSSLIVYNENLHELLRKEELHGGTPLKASLRVENPGRYWVRLHDRGNNGYSMESYTLTAVFAPEVDVNEPNDRFSQPTVITQINQMSGIVYPHNDWDWYRFDVTESGRIRIQISQPEGIYPDLRLYNDSRVEIARVHARNANESIMLIYDISEPDSYYVSVRDNHEAHVSESPYILTIEGAATPQSAPIAEPFFDMTPNPAQVGQMVTLTGVGSDPASQIVDYEWTSNLAGKLGQGASLTVQNLSPGIHSIGLRVRNAAGVWSGRVEHHLIVTETLWQESEYNNAWQQAYSIPLNTWVTGQISPRRDQDFYRIYLEECGWIRVLLDALPPSMRGGVAMYNEKGDWMYINSAGINAGEWVDVSWYATPGYYYIGVRDAGEQANGATYALKAFFEPAGDRFEPNSPFALSTPVALNEVLEDVTICPRGDEDWYQVNVTQQGRLRMDVSSPPETMRSEIAMYNEHYDWLYTHTSAINPGDPIHLYYDVVDPGIYYIRVRDLQNRGHVDPYVFQTAFTPVVDQYEPNFGHGVATLLEGPVTEGYLFRGDDHDWYRFYMEAGATAEFQLTQVPESQRSELALFGVEREWLYRNNTANNPGDLISQAFTAETSGTYYLRIQDVNRGSHLQPYVLKAAGDVQFGFEPEFAPVQVENEPNSGWANANDISLNSLVSGAIHPERDTDQYRCWINAPGILLVEHTRVAESVTSEMWVFNKHLGEIRYRTATNPGEDNLLEVAITEPGWHYIRIRDRGNNHSDESPYQLRLTHTPVVDEYEPNNGLGDATQLSESSIQGYLFDGNDVDWYRVYVREPTQLSVSLVETPESNRPRLRIYDSNGAEKGSWVHTNPGEGGEDVLSYEAPTAGFYFLRVNDEGKIYSPEPYTIRISGADFSRAPSLTAIGDRVIEASIPYAMRLYAEDPDNPADLVYSASNLPPGAQFDPVTRMFEWLPSANQAGVYSGVMFEVSDGEFTDNESITITVETHNVAPELSAIGNQVILVESEFRLSLSAIDPNAGDMLSFSADHLPRGAVFDIDSATLVWTPESNQLGLHSGILFVVTDGARSDFEYVSIEVVDELIPPDPRTVWWNTHFTEIELMDPEISGENADPDRDRMTNEQEFEADTNPRDASSLLKIIQMVWFENGVEIHWIGGVASDRFLEKRILLNGQEDWKVIHSEEAPTKQNNSVFDEFAGDGTGFYRIRAVRP